MRLGLSTPPLAVVISALVCVACAPSANDPVAEIEDPGAILVDAVALERFFIAQLEDLHIPGLAVAIVDKTGVLFSAGYGWADLEGGVPMTPDTVINIASISKTVTSLAVLQLRDQGLLSLDDDVNRHLPFAVRHPAFAETKITVRQLLTHTSGIQDGEAYGASYACGDPAVPLETWIRGYLEVGGSYYDADQNFLATAPGKAYSYCNVGFGLLGYLVETVSGVPFADYIQSNVFEPLGMTESGWYLSDMDPRLHATPYAWMEAGSTLENDLFVETGDRLLEEDEFVPFCLYSFFNIPDGLVRTSVRQLANYLVAHIRGGEFESRRILARSTVEEILSPQLDDSMIQDGGHVQGLAWRKRSLDVGEVWGHGGADPGVRTYMGFSPDKGRGVILFANGSIDIRGVVERLIDEALK
jgi:CubicO group peptidase (beta-lactamase class C family)